MTFPKRICSICSEEFELKPGKPGFANRCPACSEEDEANVKGTSTAKGGADRDLNAARRQAMRDLLYRKDS
jgi:hypothetical protein